jgi:hypothetical protein
MYGPDKVQALCRAPEVAASDIRGLRAESEAEEDKMKAVGKQVNVAAIRDHF